MMHHWGRWAALCLALLGVNCQVLEWPTRVRCYTGNKIVFDAIVDSDQYEVDARTKDVTGEPYVLMYPRGTRDGGCQGPRTIRAEQCEVIPPYTDIVEVDDDK